jgi:hypothetical protein
MDELIFEKRIYTNNTKNKYNRNLLPLSYFSYGFVFRGFHYSNTFAV